MDFQKADIDVQLHAWGRSANVSEKFRSADYNDLFIELYSMYPHEKGWMENSSADYLAYFFSNRIVWVNKKELITVFKKSLESHLKAELIEQLMAKFPSKNGKIISTINLLNKTYKINYIKAHNSDNQKKWDTIGVSIPFPLLEDLGLNLKFYPV